MSEFEGHWRKQIEEESVKVGLSGEDALCRSSGVLVFFRLK